MPTRSKTSKSLVALLVVVVVLLIRGTRRQRRLLRLLTGFSFTYVGEGIVNQVGGWFGGIGDDIKQYVSIAVGVVADALQTAVDFVRGVAYGAAQLAWDLYNNVKDLAWSFTQTAFGFARSLFDAATSAAWSLFVTVKDLAWSFGQTAIGVARDLFDGAISLARTLVTGAIHLAWDFGQTAIGIARSLFDAGLDFTRTFGQWVLDTSHNLLTAAISALHDTVFAGIDLARSEAGAAISTVNDYLFGTVSAVLDVVTAVLEWLVALATFPFTTARDMWAAFRQTGGRTIVAHAPAFVARWGDHIKAHNVAYVAADRFDYQLPSLGDVISGRDGSAGGVVGPGVGTPDRLVFAAGLLDALGAPATESNIAFLVAWMTREGTSASYNPLATTLDYGDNTRFNSVGVRNYADLHTGIAATAQTLTHSGYPQIVAALRAGDGRAAGQQHGELRRWSDGGYDTIAA